MTTMNATLTTTLEDNQHGLAATIGLFTGVYVGIALALLASAPLLAPWSLVLMSVTGALGTIGSLRFMPDVPPSRPVRTALRFLALTLPVYLIVQFIAGSLALSGFALLAAAAMTSLAIPFMEEDIEDEVRRESRTDQHRRAIERLAHIDRTVQEEQARHRAQIADFDRRLATALNDTTFETETAFEFEVVREFEERAA